MEKIKKSGCITGILLNFFGFLFLFLALTPGNIIGSAILGAMGTTLLITYSFTVKRKLAQWFAQQTLLANENPELYMFCSAKRMTKHLLWLEIHRKGGHGGQLGSRAQLQDQGIYTLAALALEVVCLFGLYHRNLGVWLACVIALVYVWLCNCTTPEQALYRRSKKDPKKNFSQMVQEDLYNEAESHKAKRQWMLSAGALVVLLVLFFNATSETRITYKATVDGLMVTKYRPALSELDKIQVPARADGQPVVAIGENVFRNFVYVKEASLPQSVRSIGSRAFKNCTQLEKIVLPENLTALGGEAFKDCTSLQSIRIPQGVTELRGNTFEGCTKLKSVTLHDGITAIHAYCFRNCESLQTIQLPSQITEIRTYTFAGCKNLKAIDIPVGVTRIAAHAFEDCAALSDVFLPDTLQQIGSSAFRRCTSLESVGMPSNVTWEENAFKESPTKIVQKRFTDAQIADIMQEFEGLQWEAPVYYMYNREAGSDAICRYGEDGALVLSDRDAYARHLTEGRDLKKVETNAALMALFEKAKEAGVTTVRVYHYTQVGSQITGEAEFVCFSYDLADLMTQLEDDL